MTYRADFLTKVHNPKTWPTFAKADFLDRLAAVAERALSRRTVDGYLAAALVYQQLTEEMIDVLLECNFFFIQLSVFPALIHPKKQSGQMYGRRVELLDKCLEFPKKNNIIRDCKKLNLIRIELVHKLPKRESLKGLAKQAHAMKRLYGKIFRNFVDAYDWFRLSFKDFRKDVFEEIKR